MSGLSSWILGILGTVIAALIVIAIKGFFWMRNSITDQKADNDLMRQRLKYNEEKLDKIEEAHDHQYNELSDKMDKTLEVLTDIKLAFSEVRIKNESNERRIERLEERA